MFSMEIPEPKVSTIELGEEQKNVIQNVIDNPHQNFFITGKAGTGKSVTLRNLKKYLPQSVVCAPTGVAAMNIGGVTLHSFFSIPPRVVTRRDAKKITDPNKIHILRLVKTIMIDEISMVSNYILDYIDEYLRINCNANKPFGGKQIVMFGDLGQLPPVVTNRDAEIVYQIYNNAFFFSANCMKTGDLKVRYLKTVYRQLDKHFLEILDAISKNEVSDKQLEELNSRVAPLTDGKICLTTTNAIADSINFDKLSKIDEPEFSYVATISGEFNPTLTKAPAELRLKKGARVVNLVNNTELGIHNGSMGEIVSLTQESIEVLFDGKLKSTTINKNIWKNKRFKLDFKENLISENTIGEFTQFGLKLAWAATVHSSQGLTYDAVHINNGSGAFASGQVYVALSRCRTLEGITMETPVTRKDIIVDQAIADFYKKFDIKFNK